MSPPQPFQPLPFSFVTPPSGTQLFYGTQRHQGMTTVPNNPQVQPRILLPSFTPCFTSTVLAYLPTFLLLLLLPVDLILLSKSAARDVSIHFPQPPSFNPSGALGLATEMSASIDGLPLAAQSRRADCLPPIPAAAFSPSTTLCPHWPGCPGSWISLQPLVKHCWQEPRAGECLKCDFGNPSQVTSGPQFFFWVASTLCQALTLTSAILGPHTEGEKPLCIPRRSQVPQLT